MELMLWSIKILSVFFRESPDETYVEMVDVNVLQTLPVTTADGKYPTIIWMYVLYMVQGTRNAYGVLIKNLIGGDYSED